MMAKVCQLDGCTFNQTGVCVNNIAIEDCPDIFDQELGPGDLGGPVLLRPAEDPRFPRSAALGTTEVSALMGERYGSIIGVLGAPDSGKTASLVSLYLMLANNSLEGFSFADSQSLMAFEEIARGARRWDEDGVHDKLTDRTELGDDRSAGLLHLRLRRRKDATCFDLFIPDLPGEWSTSLIDKNVSERLEFIRSSDAVWLMSDGSALFDPARRPHSLHRLCLLVDRLAALLGDRRPPVFLITTRLDLGTPDPTILSQVTERALRHGIEMQIKHIASFSADDTTPPGKGISELLEATLSTVDTSDSLSFWPDPSTSEQPNRHSLRFRRVE